MQIQLLARISERLLPDGYLVIGVHESLPDRNQSLVKASPGTGIYRRASPNVR
jgi:chemotaxis methyl-accepting protein methylase